MKTLSFNKHAFIYYREKMSKAGFPVEKYNNKELKTFMSEFIQSVNKVKGYYTDPEREHIVVNNMLCDIRDKKLNDILS